MGRQTYFSVAEYIRLSREDGDKVESDSIGNQRKLIAEYLKNKEEFIVYDTYIDDGFTGTNFERTAFKRMIADIKAGKVNCVIVKDLSRFGRDYIDTGKYLERFFPDNDVRFISITDNIDSIKQAYDMLLPIKNIFNEQYARDISKKVHAAMNTKQKAGEFIGAFASYGYKKSLADKNKLVIDEYAANVIRRIFDLYIKGNGKIKIAGMLNAEGILCPSEYKKVNGENYRNSNRLESTSYWTYSTINRILSNEMYVGNMVQGKTQRKMHSRAKLIERQEWIVVPNTHEAIIDIDTWNKAQKLLKRRTRNLDLQSNISIFAGFLKCGDCGRALTKKRYLQNGKEFIYYNCGTYVRSGSKFCSSHSISHKVLEKIILEDLNMVISSIDNLKELIAGNKIPENDIKQEVEADRKRIQAELCKVRNKKRAIYEDYQEKLISKEEYISYRQDYIIMEEKISKQIEHLEEKSKEGNVEDIFELQWIKHLLELGKVEQLDRNIVVDMVHMIKVFNNQRIKVVYNFSDELELFLSKYENYR